MGRFKIAVLLFCSALLCLGICRSTLAQPAEQNSHSAPSEHLLADEIKFRNQLAQDISAAHLLARLKADELIAEHKFGQARQLVRRAQEMLLAHPDNISKSIFEFLDTLGRRKLQDIDHQEVLFLRKRLASERAASAKLTAEVSGPTQAAPAVLPTSPATRVATALAKPAESPPMSVRLIGRPARRSLRTIIPRIQYDGIPLSEALDDLRSKSGANIVVNWQSLASAGVEKTASINLQLRNVSTGRALKIILDNLSTEWAKLSYVVQEDVLVIASSEDLARIIDTRVYDITHLMIQTRDKRGGSEFAPGRGSGTSGRGSGNGGRAADRSNRDKRSSGSTSRRDGRAGADDFRSEQVDRIIALVHATAPRESWSGDGGPGSVTVFGARLIVTQTAENHARIAKTLALIGW